MASHADKWTSRQVIHCKQSPIDPIIGVEVKSALKLMGNTAASLNKLLPKDLKEMHTEALAAYFNFLLLTEGCPSHLCCSPITLIPKIHVPVSTSDLGPTPVSSVLVSCFHKVLVSLWNVFLKFSSHQFAFLQREGCLEATSLLHAFLHHSSCTASNPDLAFIDVSKAFDSISHDTINRSAAAFGAPPPLQRYLVESYKQVGAQFPNLEENVNVVLSKVIHYLHCCSSWRWMKCSPQLCRCKLCMENSYRIWLKFICVWSSLFYYTETREFKHCPSGVSDWYLPSATWVSNVSASTFPLFSSNESSFLILNWNQLNLNKGQGWSTSNGRAYFLGNVPYN